MMRAVVRPLALCASLMALAAAGHGQKRSYTHTAENVANWGRVAGQVARGVKACPFEAMPDAETIFGWSKAKHGPEHQKEFDLGFSEIDDALAKVKKPSKVCDALLETLGPTGSVVEGFIASKAQVAAALQEAPEQGPLKMTAGQLLKSVGNNELRLRREVEQAGGLLVTGKVENVENGYFGTGPMVALRVGSFSNVMAHIEKSELETAVKLNSGDTVTMLCRNPTNIAKGFSAAVYSCVFR